MSIGSCGTSIQMEDEGVKVRIKCKIGSVNFTYTIIFIHD
jgi:hypothetical protein